MLFGPYFSQAWKNIPYVCIYKPSWQIAVLFALFFWTSILSKKTTTTKHFIMKMLTILYLHLKFKNNNKIEPRHDKTNKMTVCQAKTQISLGIRPV